MFIYIIMHIFCYIRYLNYNDKYIVYVKPSFYKNFQYLKYNYNKEKQLLQQTVKMLNPIILGNYNITRSLFNKYCKEHFNNYNYGVFTFNYDYYDSNLILESINNLKSELESLFLHYYLNDSNPDLSFIVSNSNTIFIDLK